MSRVQTTATTILFALLLAGCSKEPTPAQRPESHPEFRSPEPGILGGRLLLSTINPPQTFNPLLANDAASGDICQFLFSSLVRMDFAAQEVHPSLAESWNVAPDGKTWTFKLRRGLRWSDGKPLTAADVVFTWNNVIFNPSNSISVAELFQISGQKFVVTNLDETTVQVVAPAIFPPFLEFFGTVAVLPKHALEQSIAENKFSTAFNAATPASQIVCSGPFRLKQLNRGASTILDRNPNYWVVDSKNQRLPYFDEVVFVATHDAVGQAGLFLSGETQIHDNIRPDEFDRFQTAAKKTGFRIVEMGSGADKDFVCFNQNPKRNPITRKPFVALAKLKWFRNTKFRQAISCAIDRDRLSREIYSGRAKPAYDFISVENKKWSNTNTVHFAYNPAKARALLAEIGLQDRNGDGFLEDTNGVAVEFDLISNGENATRGKTAVLLQEMFAKLGIKMTFTPLPFQKLLEKVNSTFDYDCSLVGLGYGGNDPAMSANVLPSAAPVHQWYPNQAKPSTEWEARIDQLMDAQMSTLDFSARKKFFDEVQMILAEQQPMIFTVAVNPCAAVSETIGNIRPSAGTPNRLTWNLEELYFKK